MGLFDKIKDVIGDIAPVVLPVAINAFLPGLGTVASGALGAGIGTLLQGGDAKDALKSAALGGGIGALKVGFLGKQGSFADNLRADFDATRGVFSRPLSESTSTLVGGVQKPFEYDDSLTEAGRNRIAVEEAIRMEQGLPTLKKDTSLLLPRTPSDDAIRASQNYADKIAAGATDKQAMAELQKELTPSVLQRFGVPAALGLGALTLFSDDEEEDDELEPFETVDSDQFKVANLDPMKFMPTMKDIQVPYVGLEDGGIATVPNKYKGFSKLPEGVQQKISPKLAKKYQSGGEVDFFPRRTGGIGPGEGSGTKDDVPAMLMDGEFVMTRDAVKAAGGGNINKGIDNMYGLMRNLEARA